MNPPREGTAPTASGKTGARTPPAPFIVDIKRHSLEDGPGIRSVVFFKGCPMRCVFCHSPETQASYREIVFSKNECASCGRCVEACPVGAVDLALPGRIARQRCKRHPSEAAGTGSEPLCRECVAACPGQGLREVGKRYEDIANLARILLRDAPYYSYSGGGVTLSGGECTMHLEYLGALLGEINPPGKKRTHITLETAGFFPYESFKRTILPHVDLIYYDVKMVDPATHMNCTGKPNDGIISNLHQLIILAPDRVHPRMPMIPKITDPEANLDAVVDLVYDAGAGIFYLLSYNPMGVAMAEGLGRPPSGLPVTFMDPKEEMRICAYVRDRIASKCGKSVKVEVGRSGGTTWFRWR